MIRFVFLAWALSLSLSLSLALARPAWSWDADGHRFVCTVASYEMNEQTRGAVKKLLALETREQFAEACVRADDAAGNRPEPPAWHRMYVPREAQSVDLARDCSGPDGCLVSAIEHKTRILQGDAPAAAKAEALKVLMHLVGDLHQPLNIGFVQDRGGADIPVVFRGRRMSLRDLWETELLRARPDTWREIAESYEARFPYIERRLWPAGTLTDWANESLWIMRTPATGYLGNPGNLAFGELFVRQNQLVVLRRLSQAGVRLGLMLNRIFAG